MTRKRGKARNPAQLRKPDGIELGYLPRPSDTERVRVAVRNYKGHRMIDIRLQYLGAEGNWLFTRKGVSLRHRDIRELERMIKEGADTLDSDAEAEGNESDEPGEK
jgi:hypothetical protein